MQKDADGNRTDEEAASFARGLKAMRSLYSSPTGTAVLLQRHVAERPAALPADAVWNPTPYERRGCARQPDPAGCRAASPTAPLMTPLTALRWTIFERGVALVAAAHMRRVKSQLTRQERPIPEAVSCAEQSRPKLVDVTGADPETLDPTDAMSSDEITEQVRTLCAQTASGSTPHRQGERQAVLRHGAGGARSYRSGCCRASSSP